MATEGDWTTPGRGRGALTNARLHSNSPSKTLRTHGNGACGYCGNLVEWFDRHDGGRIPLTPMEFPSPRVPLRYRWSVSGGVARPGAYGRIDQFCRIAHPAICPAVEHDDLDPAIHPLHQALGVRMQKLISEGSFIPRLRDEAPTEDAAQDVEPDLPADRPVQRHVLACNNTLRIAPGPIDELQCVALDEETQDRCKRGVFELDEGQWVQVPVPPSRARPKSTVKRPMWVWEVNPLASYLDALRWLRQHCPAHHQSEAPDTAAVELVGFHTDRHARYITLDRPAGFQPTEAPADTGPQGPKTTTCAGDHCNNTTVVPEAGADWLCYRCARRARTRVATARRWQQPDSDRTDRA
ncbi:DUF6083 domain-containing protein [Kitasatospora sp. NPDC059088]|uniref:DUF6083 domain-containing protein n=1 Tax=Kitasatospora sp. NPDC059088 TaxID=3346722 RepID=UPI0036BF68FE